MKLSSWKWGAPLAALLVMTGAMVGCGGNKANKTEAGGGAYTPKKAFTTPPGADPSVPAEMGGNGFEKIAADSGWSDGGLTQEMIALIADPAAKKGGQMTSGIGDFPATFRIFGKDANTATNAEIGSLVYEPLIDINPITLGFMPKLASHWRIDPKDSQTYWFRINPNARFSDGHPVTTEDVIATYKLGMDSTILDPFQNSFYSDFDPPVAVSKYILKVRSKKNNWKNMMYFGGQQVYPAHVIGNVGGGDFLKKFQYEMPPGSGPYIMLPEGLQKQKSITLTRLADWWAKDLPVNTGQFNFDKLKFLYIEDENLQYQKLIAGDIDWFLAGRSQWWMQRFNEDEFQRGLIQKRKIWNDAPQGLLGFAFNTRRAPFNDPKIRQAFTLLFNREELIQKLMYNERTISDSYFPNSPYANPNNPKYRYNPETAAQLLAEAGYTSRNGEGILVRNGKPFEIELPINKGEEVILTPVQQDLKKAGIKLSFRLVDFAQKVKLMDERNFDLVYQGYTGIPFPNPEPQWHSKFADKQNTNNLTGFKNPEADRLIELEQVTADPAKRKPILQALDSIFMSSNNFALAWYSPFTRFAVWSYIAMPKFGMGRIGDYRDIYQRWWYDPEIKAKVDQARKDKSIKLPIPPVDTKFWPEWDQQHPGGLAAPSPASGKPGDTAGQPSIH
jgi:microcin C transport system substrate-binding protein